MFLVSLLLYHTYIYHALASIKIFKVRDNEAAFSKHCNHWFGFANDISMHVISTWSHNYISKLNCLAVQNLLCLKKTSPHPNNPWLPKIPICNLGAIDWLHKNSENQQQSSGIISAPYVALYSFETGRIWIFPSDCLCPSETFCLRKNELFRPLCM